MFERQVGSTPDTELALPLRLDRPSASDLANKGRLKLHSTTDDWTRALQRTASIKRSGTRTLSVAIDEIAERYPERLALVGETCSLTYAELSARVHQYTAWARRESLTAGDTVALMMSNDIEYIAIWLGLSRRGVVTALLNTQLIGEGLRHSIDLSKPRHIIVDDAHVLQIQQAAPCRLPVSVVVKNDAEYCARTEVDCAADEDVQLSEQALLIYTSGTTDLPKAARISHYRIMMWCEWFAGIMDATPEDRLYNCLPMYHSIGGVVAVGSMLVVGGTVIIRDGFSVSRFWSDVVESRATIFQYIGELCRYLLGSPELAESHRHHLRLCCGNGLRSDIWTQFKNQFRIPRIVEFYAATEGTFSLFNLEGCPGAIGRIPRFMMHRSNVAIVRFDHNYGAPARGPSGFCVRCECDEVGEAIGCIIGGDRNNQVTLFEGYSSSVESEKKILRNVFHEGDSWFRTGDLMRRDAQGFYFFVDRIGDTFRWKGENVSTAEVTDVLSTCVGIKQVAVYGVQVPFADGRAGMASIVTDETFDIDTFRRHVADQLPRYANPLFLRLCAELDQTGTFKVRKVDLVREAFDLSAVGDPLFIAIGDAYVPLSLQVYRSLQRGDLII